MYKKIASKCVMNVQKNTRCDACDITYQKSNSLKRHNDQIHSDHPAHQCPKCSKRLGGKLELGKHMQTHDAENFFKSVCGFCGKKSKTKESHLNHIKYNHTRERIHKCKMCPKVFPYKSALECHQSFHEIFSGSPSCNLCFDRSHMASNACVTEHMTSFSDVSSLDIQFLVPYPNFGGTMVFHESMMINLYL